MEESRESLAEFLPWPKFVADLRSAEAALAGIDAGRSPEFGLFERSSSKLAASSSLERATPNPHVWEVAFWTSAPFRRRQLARKMTCYATAYAFATLGAVRVQLTHDRANTASEGLAASLGFRREGVMRGLTTAPDGLIGSRCTGDGILWALTRDDLPSLAWYGAAERALRVA